MIADFEISGFLDLNTRSDEQRTLGSDINISVAKYIKHLPLQRL